MSKLTPDSSVLSLHVYTWWYWWYWSFLLFHVWTAETLDVGEYLEISGIMRTQAGRYECKACNDVATPDVKYVNVIVNCKYHSAMKWLFFSFTSFTYFVLLVSIVADKNIQSFISLGIYFLFNKSF